jgi:K+-transporting ATPase KdpF subunit
MDFENLLVGVVIFGLVVYLTYTVIYPEKF